MLMYRFGVGGIGRSPEILGAMSDGRQADTPPNDNGLFFFAPGSLLSSRPPVAINVLDKMILASYALTQPTGAQKAGKHKVF